MIDDDQDRMRLRHGWLRSRLRESGIDEHDAESITTPRADSNPRPATIDVQAQPKPKPRSAANPSEARAGDASQAGERAQPREPYQAQARPEPDRASPKRDRKAMSGAPALFGDAITLTSGDLIPSPDLAILHSPGSARARGYQVLHGQLAGRIDGTGDHPAIAVVSQDGGVGRSSTAANLAVLFARSGLRVLLIEADFTRPSLTRMFGTTQVSGIGDWICGRATLCGVVFDELPGLTLIPAGRSAPGLTEKLAHPGFRRWLSRISGEDLVVLIDTAAAAAAVETESIAVAAGGALLVARRDRTRLTQAKLMTERLRERGVDFLGAALLD